MMYPTYPSVDIKRTGQRIKELMVMNDLTVTDVQEYLCLSCVQSIYRWINGKTLPSVDNLYALSELFHTSIDDIIRGSKDEYYHVVREVSTIYYGCQ